MVDAAGRHPSAREPVCQSPPHRCARPSASRSSSTRSGSCSRRRPRGSASAAPVWTRMQPSMTACRAEPQRRSTWTPGTSTGRPASSAATLPIAGASPFGEHWPSTTSSTSSPFEPDALDDRVDHGRGERRGFDVSEHPAEATDRRAQRFADHGLPAAVAVDAHVHPSFAVPITGSSLRVARCRCPISASIVLAVGLRSRR